MKFRIITWPEVERKVARVFGPLEWMIPPWCKRVKIITEPSCTDTINIHTKYDYREGLITIGPEFWEFSEQSKREMARHELIHLTLCPLSDWARQLIGSKLDDDPFLKQMLFERVESVTEDIRTLLESAQVHARGSSVGRVLRKVKASKGKANVRRGVRED